MNVARGPRPTRAGGFEDDLAPAWLGVQEQSTGGHGEALGIRSQLAVQRS